MTLFTYVKRQMNDIASREQASKLQRLNSFSMKQALDTHTAWVDDFRAHILDDANTSPFSVSAIANDKLSELGRWLHDFAQTGQELSEEFRELCTLHSEFHKTAGDISQLYNHGRIEISRRRLNSDLQSKSEQVQAAIVRYFSRRTQPT